MTAIYGGIAGIVLATLVCATVYVFNGILGEFRLPPQAVWLYVVLPSLSAAICGWLSRPNASR